MATLVDRKPDVLLSPMEQSATNVVVRPILRIEQIAQAQWAAGLSAFAPFVLPNDDALYFLGYKADQVLTVGTFAADRTIAHVPVDRIELGTGWTCLLPFMLASQSFVLAYHNASGDITAGTITKDAAGIHITQTSLNPARVDAGSVAFVLNGQSSAYLLVYAAPTLSAWQITSDQSGITLTALAPLTDFGEGWTTFIPVPLMQPDLYFLAYNSNSATGSVAAGRIAPDTNTLQLTSVTSTTPFPTGLTFLATDFQDSWLVGYQGLWLMGCKPSPSNGGSSTVMAGFVTLAPQDAGIKIDNNWSVEDWQLQPSYVVSFAPRTKTFFLAYQAIAGEGEQEGMIYIDAGPRPGIGDGEPPDPIVDAPATDKSIRR